MGKVIIECPNCHHIHKVSDQCKTCAQEREWVVSGGSLRCKSCSRGISSYPCDACRHDIPMIADFVAYFADYEDCEGLLPEIVDEVLHAQRYNEALDLLKKPWIKYELPPGYPIAEKQSSAGGQRVGWLVGAMMVGAIISGIVGALLFEEFGAVVGLLGGTILAGGFAWVFGGRMGKKNGVFIDAGLIVVSGALGVFALLVVIGGAVVWFVLSMFTDS